MSTTYTAVPANGANPGSAAITIPADGDPDNAATFNAGLQKLADYIANIGQVGRVRSGSIIDIPWGGAAQAGTFAASTTFVLLTSVSTSLAVATFGPDVTSTVGAAGVHRLTANTTGVYRIWVSCAISNNTANLVILGLMKNGSTTPVPQGLLGQLSNTSPSAPFTAECYLSLAATNFVQLGFYGTSGQTYSVGLTNPNDVWFGMERVA